MKLLLTSLCLWLFLPATFAADFLDVFKGDGFGGAQKRLIVNRIGQCPSHKNLPIYFTEFKVTKYNATDYVVNGEVIFKEDFPNGWTGSATVKRCDDFSALSNCRPFLNNIANTDICTLLGPSAAVYTRYFDKMVPKPQCPFKKGSYILKDQLVEDEVARLLPGSGSTYWEVRTTGKVGDRMVLCFILQLNIRPRKTKES